MNDVEFPASFRLEILDRRHGRGRFDCGDDRVNEWLQKHAWQNQKKRLSVTKVLLDPVGAIAGYYTLATGQVDFAELPDEIVRKLPRRQLPVAVLAWLGVSLSHQGHGLGALLLA